jgi:hypothetical protein
MPISRLIYMAVATVIGAGAAQSQQREAVLQRIEIAGAGFDVVIATPKPGSASADYRAQPDPNLVYLGNGDLIHAYTGDRQDPAGDAIFSPPASTFNVEHKASGTRTPVVIYVIPKGTAQPVAISK